MKIFQGNRLSLFREDTQDNKWIEYIKKPDSCLVVPFDGQAFLTVRVWRHTMNSYSLEFPGGAIDGNETAEEGAKRELLEETGLVAEKLCFLGSFHPLPSVTDEMCSVFICRFGDFSLASRDDQEIASLEVVKLDGENSPESKFLSGPDLLAHHLACQFLIRHDEFTSSRVPSTP